MSNALAISGVTAILQYYLNDMYSSAQGFSSQVTVSCLAPDQVQNGLGGAADIENQVNLFLHQVTHNAAWRNVELAQMSADGTQRLKSPPLALNLHYLLTAYGSDFWQAEALLGYALMLLHEVPVLTRKDIAHAITMLTHPPPPTPVPYPLNPLTKVLDSVGLADQIEMIKITPETLGREEMAWLWTALKADYRPTFPFQVSVVLMQPSQSTSSTLPVLKPAIQVFPMQPVKVTGTQFPLGKMAWQPGDTVTVTGEFLAGATQVVLTNPRYGAPPAIPVLSANSGSLTFVLPADLLGEFPAGTFGMTVQWMDPSQLIVVRQASNTVPLEIAPILPSQSAAATAATTPSGLPAVLVKLTNFTPQVWEGQTVSLSLSTLTTPYINQAAPAQPITGKMSELHFLFETGLPTGQGLLARLTVDGVASQVSADLTLPIPFLAPLVTLL